MLTRIRDGLAAATVVVVILWSPGIPGIEDLSTASSPEVEPPGQVFRICKYPDYGQAWSRRDAVRVRLDPDRLRAHGVTREDVMQAMQETTLNSPPPVRNPPPGVVFARHLGRPDQFAKIVLKANAEGEVVRLQDVAAVEAGW